MLLRGPSGAGKSGLALRLAWAGWRLTADDRVMVWPSGGRLYGRAPDTLAGLVEARGLGVLAFPTLTFAPLSLIVDLVPTVERMPNPRRETVAGITLPAVDLRPDEAEATAKLALALACAATSLGVERQQAYQAARTDEPKNRPARDFGAPE